MKTYTEEKKTSTYTVLREVKCDLCGKTTTSQWKDNAYDAVEVEVKLRTGTSFPEGGNGEETQIDLCPDCFLGKLVPWVKSQGGVPTKKEWDW